MAEFVGNDMMPLNMMTKAGFMASEVQMVGGGDLEMEPPTSSSTETKMLLTLNHDQRLKSQDGFPMEQDPLATEPKDAQGFAADAQVLPIFSSVQKTEPPGSELEHVGRPVQVEPQQANISTAENTAYSPSSSDEAVASLQLRVWERIDPVKENNNPLQLKLKLAPLEQEVMRPCSVQLVDLLAVSNSGYANNPIDFFSGRDANGKTGLPVPRELRRHQGLHTGHRLCCFTRCENDIWRLQSIVTHSRDGYACNSCDKKFKRRKILRRHERFHTGEKPYSCSQCSKAFALRKSLRRHERFHTGERPHSCPHCGKSFRLRDNLKAHLRFHTGEKPFICSTCGKSFRISRNLQKHNLSQCGLIVPSFRKIAGL
ncbi:zinc finger protein 768 [Lampris incognitus]|uniref:zinc finger protein 768 n=1 Tax=Lampris incognitus TaxID=2546036 RepID=UPI0024B4BA4C|nr:zinc finger protein 768 [Lampris incognitus]